MELNSINNILDKISSSLNFFDFSFVVSGFATFFTIFCTTKKIIVEIDLPKDKFTLAIFAIILIYICGILSYAAGKYIRKNFLQDNFEQDLKQTIKNENKIQRVNNNEVHIINIDELDDTEMKQLYDQMWISLRHDEEGCKTVDYLNRSVMMQSICEGLLFSCIIMFFCSLILMLHDFHHLQLAIWMSSIIFGLFFNVEAKRCAQIQRRQAVGAYYKFILNSVEKTSNM